MQEAERRSTVKRREGTAGHLAQWAVRSSHPNVIAQQREREDAEGVVPDVHFRPGGPAAWRLVLIAPAQLGLHRPLPRPPQ